MSRKINVGIYLIKHANTTYIYLITKPLYTCSAQSHVLIWDYLTHCNLAKPKIFHITNVCFNVKYISYILA